MKHITGLRKYFYLARGLLNIDIFKLPVGFVWFMFRQMRHEKLTHLNGKTIVSTNFSPLPSKSYNSALRRFVQMSKGEFIPFSAYFAVTDRCPYDCWYCSNGGKTDKKDLSTEETKKIIKILQAVGVSCIGFSGGEPLEREDINELIKSVDARSYSILFTTGYGLTQEKAFELRNAGLQALVVSLDSHIKEEQNISKSNDKAYENAVNAVKCSVEAGIYTALNMVISKDMLYSDKKNEYLKFAGEIGVHELRILEPSPCGKLFSGEYEKFTEEDRMKIREFQYEVNKDPNLPKVMAYAHATSDGIFGCGAGIYHMHVTAKGEVTPCDLVQVAAGNLLKESFADIMKRMREFIPRPSEYCISKGVAEKANWNPSKGLPLKDYEKNKTLLNSLDYGRMPLMYAKLVKVTRLDVGGNGKMKIKNIYHFLSVLFVCACTGLNGWFFGQAGGNASAITGGISGVIAGYLFLYGYYKTNRIWKVRLAKATKLGGIYGAISGFLVYVPSFFVPNDLVHSSLLGMFIMAGIFIGWITGSILGNIFGRLLFRVRMEKEVKSNPAA
ncbi:MAG: hypothetical protein A2452_09745 [Candidatus Firestonebacteria bacterium RIFOXYC2_FULL_39_67]|nr:MAG: hypothetical protein A2536_04025 [Candidatus Firestonebacteria bacterium RIFOXYD2_FULL_39_29]OGF51854.1 MAG: hypothetical protein A2497_00740 [Candidatus Firestonebacteria bacterium RifOxyC12_full_39_7]OGF54645.1 MAG: hypothetical protein A2452_09745 [Candidatus Firestonebacteria bacterium RIFOXYC2_FULL_39_67]